MLPWYTNQSTHLFKLLILVLMITQLVVTLKVKPIWPGHVSPVCLQLPIKQYTIDQSSNGDRNGDKYI